MQKIAFVTGGSGFVGRNLIRGLVARGYAVRALARSDAAATTVTAAGATPVRGDVLDRTALVAGMKGASLLFHAAADTGHGQGTPEQARVNIEGTRTVYEAAREAGIRRAVQISSEAVLADGRPLLQVDERHPIPERHAGEYSRTKALAERTALAQSRDGLEVVVVRPRFIWGRDDTTALPQIVDAARQGKLMWIGGGEYLISTCHIDNAVDGAIRAAEHGRAGEVYFVTDGAPVPFRDFVTRLLATQGLPAPTRSVPRFVVRLAIAGGELLGRITGGRVGPPMSFQEYATLGLEVTLRDDKARKELGYAPSTSREAGLADLAERARAGRVG